MLGKEKLVILGATENQVPLIKKAQDMGYETHVFAWQHDDPGEYEADYFYPISVRNKNLILQECQRLKPAGLITISSDLGTLALTHIAKELQYVSHRCAGVETAVNKRTAKRLLEKLGISVPRYRVADDIIPETEFTYPVVVKPTDRSGSKGVSLAHNRSELVEAVTGARELSFERKALIEEYMAGDLYTAECISVDGQHTVLAITKSEYDVAGNQFVPKRFVQTPDILHEVLPVCETAILQILNAFEFTNGASNIEFFIKDKEISVLEVSPCLHGEFVGSHLIPYTTGFDYLAHVIRIACDTRMEVPSVTVKNSGCIYFSKEKPASKPVRPIIDGFSYLMEGHV